MNSYCGHGEKEICDKKKETEFFDESKKEEIAEVVGAHKDEEFLQKEISQVVDKESEIIGEITDVIEDCGNVEIVNFVGTDKFF